MIEELVAFTSTHLAMVTFLMPWKKIVETTIAEPKVDTTVLWTIWDMNNVDKWYYKTMNATSTMPVEDESLSTMVIVFLTLLVVSLALSISKWALVTFYNAIDPNVTSVVDFLSWGTVLSLLITMVISQSDFDKAWAFNYHEIYEPEHTADTDAMFLPIGVVAVHLAILSYFVGNDIMERLKEQ